MLTTFKIDGSFKSHCYVVKNSIVGREKIYKIKKIYYEIKCKQYFARTLRALLIIT